MQRGRREKLLSKKTNLHLPSPPEFQVLLVFVCVALFVFFIEKKVIKKKFFCCLTWGVVSVRNDPYPEVSHFAHRSWTSLAVFCSKFRRNYLSGGCSRLDFH